MPANLCASEQTIDLFMCHRAKENVHWMHFLSLPLFHPLSYSATYVKIRYYGCVMLCTVASLCMAQAHVGHCGCTAVRLLAKILAPIGARGLHSRLPSRNPLHSVALPLSRDWFPQLSPWRAIVPSASCSGLQWAHLVGNTRGDQFVC